MRSILVILLALFCAACDGNVTRPSAQYDSMSFKRFGGGELAFAVTPSTRADGYLVMVTHLEFRDTTIALGLARDSANSAAFATLARALDGRARLTGSFTQSPLPTGTWAYVYMVKGADRVEVTNGDLRDTLLVFERLVRVKL